MKEYKGIPLSVSQAVSLSSISILYADLALRAIMRQTTMTVIGADQSIGPLKEVLSSRCLRNIPIRCLGMLLA